MEKGRGNPMHRRRLWWGCIFAAWYTLQYGKPGLKNLAIMTVGDTKVDWRSVIEQV
jgi:hypothetical protein